MPKLVIDQSRRCIILDGEGIQLSPQEYRVLSCLAQSIGEVVPKADLVAALWPVAEHNVQTSAGYSPVAVDLVVHRLRKKLNDSADNPTYLETRRGFGYILHHVRLTQGELTRSHRQMATGVSDRHPPAAAASTAAETATYAEQPWMSLTRQEW
jgi:DNA-binding winged helix-turn-helix (wHTH) protein